MATRAVVYFHHKDEYENGLEYTMKLYHHRDGDLDWLGQNLNTIFSDFKKEYESNNSWSLRPLFKAIWDEGWFEMTPYTHSDTEYVYHVYYEDLRDIGALDGKVFNFRIYFQKAGDHKWIWWEPMTIYSINWKIDERFLDSNKW